MANDQGSGKATAHGLSRSHVRRTVAHGAGRPVRWVRAMAGALEGMPKTTAGVLAKVEARLRSHYGRRLREVRLYGSVARGEATETSDVDVLVVLDAVHALRDRTEAMANAGEAGLQEDPPLVVEVQVLSVDELAFLRRTETLLARNLDRDGIVLWKAP